MPFSTKPPPLAARRRTWLERLYLSGRSHSHRGVRVTPFGLSKVEAAVAFARVDAALDHIAQSAPHHLERLPQLLHGLAIARLAANYGAWYPSLAVGCLDRDFVLDPNTSPARIATLIVHELTHARLAGAGFRQPEIASARYERICYLAERNFIARLPASTERRSLEDLNRRYLESLPHYCSEAAVAGRLAAWRARQPLWRRFTHDVLSLLGRAHRAALLEGTT